LNRKRVALAAIIIGVTALSIVILRPIITGVVYGLFLGYILIPLVKKLDKVLKNKVLAAALPVSLVFILMVLVSASVGLTLMDIARAMGSRSFQEWLENAETQINTILYRLNIEYTVKLSEVVSSLIAPILKIETAISIVGKVWTFIVDGLVTLGVAYYVMRDGEEIASEVMEVLPQEPAIKNFISRLKMAVDGVFYGYFLTSLVQGLTAGAFFVAINFEYWALAAFLTFIFGVLPILGAPMVYIPIAIYMWGTSPLKAIATIIYGVVVLTIIPTFILTPAIGSARGKVHPLTVFLGIIGGPIVLGAAGLIIGPVALAAATTALKTFLTRGGNYEENRGETRGSDKVEK